MAKLGSMGPMPWDMVIYLTITAASFGFSIKRVMTSDLSSSQVDTDVIDSVDAEALNPNGLTSHILNLGCIEKELSQMLTSEKNAIRIRGRLCHLSRSQMMRFDGIRVRNVSTGEEGTIFLKGDENVFITDYIKLASGRNVIQLEWKDTKQSAPRVYVAEIYER